jgi:opacity protein-like surface antigen
MRHHRLVFGIVSIWLSLVAKQLGAQTDEDRDDVGEVSTYTGVGFGSLGTRAWVGGTTGAAMSKYAIALIDTSFLPIGGATLAAYPGLVTSRSRLYDFNFTVHIQIPVNRRWTPYALVGSGLLFNTYQVQVIRPDGIISFYGQDDAKFGFQTGGGARYFIGEDWGVKGEYRYTISTQNFSRILVGVFYQFHEPWPFLPRSKRRGAGRTY